MGLRAEKRWPISSLDVSQLIIYHFMFHPDESGCPHCSLRADGFSRIGVHLNQRDVTMVMVSRAPFIKLEEYRKRMGWNLKWVSSGDPGDSSQ
jgi:predicted dithiol-disulfide oxidoreductase (DUF899 family)